MIKLNYKKIYMFLHCNLFNSYQLVVFLHIFDFHIQVKFIIILNLESIETDHIISEAHVIMMKECVWPAKF